MDAIKISEDFTKLTAEAHEEILQEWPRRRFTPASIPLYYKKAVNNTTCKRWFTPASIPLHVTHECGATTETSICPENSQFSIDPILDKTPATSEVERYGPGAAAPATAPPEDVPTEVPDGWNNDFSPPYCLASLPVCDSRLEALASKFVELPEKPSYAASPFTVAPPPVVPFADRIAQMPPVTFMDQAGQLAKMRGLALSQSQPNLEEKLPRLPLQPHSKNLRPPCFISVFISMEMTHVISMGMACVISMEMTHIISTEVKLGVKLKSIEDNPRPLRSYLPCSRIAPPPSWLRGLKKSAVQLVLSIGWQQM